MIEVQNLTKKYGIHTALDDVSFSVKKEEIIGFLGPNGAGKSTTMNILTGYLSCNVGSVKINGYDILENPILAKRNIGYLPEIPPLYPEMTVNSYLKFIYGIKKVNLNKEKHLEEIMSKVGLLDVRKKLIRNLSKGYKQRVGFAGALIGDPKVLILDEPTVGFDPRQIIEIRNLIESLRFERTIFFSSHILTEVQSICDRVLVINKGKVIANDTTNNLSEKLKTKGSKILNVTVEGAKEEILKALKSIKYVEKVNIAKKFSENIFKYELCSDGTDVKRNLFFTLSELKSPILELKNSDVSLEDIFLELTQETVGEKNASNI